MPLFWARYSESVFGEQKCHLLEHGRDQALGREAWANGTDVLMPGHLAQRPQGFRQVSSPLTFTLFQQVQWSGVPVPRRLGEAG